MFQVFRNNFSGGMMRQGVEVVVDSHTICYLSPYKKDDWKLEAPFNQSPLEEGELEELTEEDDLTLLNTKEVK